MGYSRRWRKRSREMIISGSQEAVNFVVCLSGLANDERGGHGPGDDRAGRDRISYSLTARCACAAARLFGGSIS